MFLVKPAQGNVRIVREIPSQALAILENGFYAYLATVEDSCHPHLTAMFYIWDKEGKTVHLIATQESKKVRNIRRNQNVAVTVDERDPSSPAGNCGVMIRGRAMLVDMDLTDELLMVDYLAKYLQFLGHGYPIGSRIAIRIRPRTISYWEGTNFYKWKNPNKT